MKNLADTNANKRANTEHRVNEIYSFKCTLNRNQLISSANINNNFL